MEKYVEPEPPQWILHKTETGQPLFWRRDGSEDNPRVKFKYEVEIKEFFRSAHEMEDPMWNDEMRITTTVSMGVTCLLCIALMILPWYIMVK